MHLSYDPKTRADRAVLTNEDTEDFSKVCAQQGDRLAAARAQVILLVGCLTGFRACGMIHLTTTESGREELCYIAELSPEFAELSSNFPGEPALLACRAKL